MTKRETEAVDRYLTGSYGEDGVPDDYCDRCAPQECRCEVDAVWGDGRSGEDEDSVPEQPRPQECRAWGCKNPATEEGNGWRWCYAHYRLVTR